MARAVEALRRPGLVASVAAIVLIGAPTLILEEDWHGRPMIDQAGHLWVVPTLIVAAAFAIGGVLAARGRAGLRQAAARGLLAGVVATGIFLAADGLRRAVRGQAVSAGVTRLWVEAAVLSVVIAALSAASAHLMRRPDPERSPGRKPVAPTPP